MKFIKDLRSQYCDGLYRFLFRICISNYQNYWRNTKENEPLTLQINFIIIAYFFWLKVVLLDDFFKVRCIAIVIKIIFLDVAYLEFSTMIILK